MNQIPTNNQNNNQYRKKTMENSSKMNQLKKSKKNNQNNMEISNPRKLEIRSKSTAIIRRSMTCLRLSHKFRRKGKGMMMICPKMCRLRWKPCQDLRKTKICLLPNLSLYKVPTLTTWKFKANSRIRAKN